MKLVDVARAAGGGAAAREGLNVPTSAVRAKECAADGRMGPLCVCSHENCVANERRKRQ